MRKYWPWCKIVTELTIKLDSNVFLGLACIELGEIEQSEQVI